MNVTFEKKVNRSDVLLSWLESEFGRLSDGEIRNVIDSNDRIKNSDIKKNMSDWELHEILNSISRGPTDIFWMCEPLVWYKASIVDEQSFKKLLAVNYPSTSHWGKFTLPDGKLKNVAKKLHREKNSSRPRRIPRGLTPRQLTTQLLILNTYLIFLNQVNGHYNQN